VPLRYGFWIPTRETARAPFIDAGDAASAAVKNPGSRIASLTWSSRTFRDRKPCHVVEEPNRRNRTLQQQLITGKTNAIYSPPIGELRTESI
jgi:hypothetical protein